MKILDKMDGNLIEIRPENKYDETHIKIFLKETYGKSHGRNSTWFVGESYRVHLPYSMTLRPFFLRGKENIAFVKLSLS